MTEVTESKRVYIRLWFWSEAGPVPHVIATGSGNTIEGAMKACFAPIGRRDWTKRIIGPRVYLFRGGAGYCGENVKDNPDMDLPDTIEFQKQLTLPPPTRQRARLEPDQPKARIRLKLD